MKSPPRPDPRYAEAYDPYDPDYIGDLIERVWGPLSDDYFRPRLMGLHRLPERGPVLLAGNHSGTAFPYDGLVLAGLLWRRAVRSPDAMVRSVFEKTLAHTWWMRPFGLDNFWRRGGGVDMTFDNFDRLLARGERVLYFPEGVPGIGKGFYRRYRLQRFSSSFAILAARHGVPVHPLYVVNAEWVIPFNFTLPPLDRLLARTVGLPFLPLPAGLLTPIFPFLFYLALPARMVFVIGEPIDVRAIARDLGCRAPDALDREEGRAVAAEIRDRMQAGLDRHVARYGRRPFAARSFLRRLRSARGRRSWFLPFTWPWFFVRHERDRRRAAARGRWHALLRDWDLFGYYLPFGWLLLALTRRLRRPPYGYRGLSVAERRRREGRFTWHLARRPLPPPTAAREP